MKNQEKSLEKIRKFFQDLLVPHSKQPLWVLIQSCMILNLKVCWLALKDRIDGSMERCIEPASLAPFHHFTSDKKISYDGRERFAGDFALVPAFTVSIRPVPPHHLMMFKQIPYCYLALFRIGPFDYSGLLDFCWNMLEPSLTVFRHCLSSRPVLAIFWQYYTIFDLWPNTCGNVVRHANLLA